MMAEKETELREYVQERCDLLITLADATPGGMTPEAFSVLIGNTLGPDATLDRAGNLTVTAEDGSGTVTVDGSGLAAVIGEINDAARRGPMGSLHSLIDRISSGNTEGVSLTLFFGTDELGRPAVDRQGRPGIEQLSLSDGNGMSAILLDPDDAAAYPSGDGRNVGAVARFAQVDPGHPAALAVGTDVIPLTSACYQNLDPGQRTQHPVTIVGRDDGRQLFFVNGKPVLAPNEPTFSTTENFVKLCAEHAPAILEIAADGRTYKSPEDLLAKIEELESAGQNPAGSVDTDAIGAEYDIGAAQNDKEADEDLPDPPNINIGGILADAAEYVKEHYPEANDAGKDSADKDSADKDGNVDGDTDLTPGQDGSPDTTGEDLGPID